MDEDEWDGIRVGGALMYEVHIYLSNKQLIMTIGIDLVLCSLPIKAMLPILC